jgi:hypothetical protein
MRALRVPFTFAAFGVLLPLLLLAADHISAHGWWPNWIGYIWPTSYMFVATSAIVDRFWYEVAVLSIGLNALLYGLVGLILSSGLRKLREDRSSV